MYVMVDIESDGPIPGDYSMVAFGAIVVSPDLDKTFYATLKPISDQYDATALAVAGFTREETLWFADPKEVMLDFTNWVEGLGIRRPIFISDNNGYDWMFMCWYFHHFTGRNPFGFSSQNLGSLYKGMVQDVTKNHKHLRKTPHTHHPLDDARGNAEALLSMRDQMKHKFPV